MKEDIEHIIEECLQGDINPDRKNMLVDELLKYIQYNK